MPYSEHSPLQTKESIVIFEEWKDNLFRILYHSYDIANGLDLSIDDDYLGWLWSMKLTPVDAAMRIHVMHESSKEGKKWEEKLV